MHKTFIRIGKSLVRVGKWFPRYYREEFQGAFQEWNAQRPARKAERTAAKLWPIAGRYTNGTPMRDEDLKLYSILSKVCIGGLVLLLTLTVMLVTLAVSGQ